MENSTPAKILGKPWGNEEILEKNDYYQVKILNVKAGESLSLQFHQLKIETMYVLSGSGSMELITDKVKTELLLKPGDFLTIHPLTQHRLSAKVDLRVLECAVGDDSDIIRLQDNYGRIPWSSDK